MSSVFVANLSPSTTKESLDKFMAFCGSIQSIEMQEGHKAVVVFEKPSAASTALMLNGGTLDGSPIQVSSEAIDEDTPSLAGDHNEHDDIPQELKPRTAIVAEYLAHGYILSENIIQKALFFDQKHGITSRFRDYFTILAEQAKQKTAELDAQTGASQKAAGAYAQADEKVKINEKASKAWQIGKGYYSKVLQSEFGQQALHFYTQTSNNVKAVHEEAQRIAADKKNASAVATGATTTSPMTTGATSSVGASTSTSTLPTTSATTTTTVPSTTTAVPGAQAPIGSAPTIV